MDILTATIVVIIVSSIAYYVGKEIGMSEGMQMERDKNEELKDQGVPDGFDSKIEFINTIVKLSEDIVWMSKEQRTALKNHLYHKL